MKPLPVTDILELPVTEHIRLVEIIWDRIAAVPEAVPISDELKADLGRRLTEFEADPEAGLPWQEVRERILQGDGVLADRLSLDDPRDRRPGWLPVA